MSSFYNWTNYNNCSNFAINISPFLTEQFYKKKNRRNFLRLETVFLFLFLYIKSHLKCDFDKSQAERRRTKCNHQSKLSRLFNALEKPQC